MQVLAVSTGRPQPLGVWQGAPVVSAIRKSPVPAATVFAGRTGLSGDAQADLAVHGGPDKAVYAYPSEHWDWWRRETGVVCKAASFGENLTTRGATEADVRIGDRFRWGEALLEVSQPRAPCHKFVLLWGREDAGARMVASGHCGFYLRVLEEGDAPTTGPMRQIAGDAAQPSVRDAFLACFRPRIDPAELDRVLAAPALAPAWAEGVARRRARHGLG